MEALGIDEKLSKVLGAGKGKGKSLRYCCISLITSEVECFHVY